VTGDDERRQDDRKPTAPPLAPSVSIQSFEEGESLASQTGAAAEDRRSATTKGMQ
jgi:hypothetical protein